MKNLVIRREINTRTDFESSVVPIDIGLLKFKYHPRVLKIKEFVKEKISEFHFSETTIENIKNEIKKWNISKKGTIKNISPKCLWKFQTYQGL